MLHASKASISRLIFLIYISFSLLLIVAPISAFAANEPWTPADINTALWYDAADASTISESAGAVSQWNDKSGNLHHLIQTTSSNQPIANSVSINGVSAIDFNGSTQNLTSSAGQPVDDVMIFVVARSEATSGQQMMFANFGAGGSQSRQFIAARKVDFGNTPLNFSMTVNTNFMIMGSVEDLGSSSIQGLRINGGVESNSSTNRGTTEGQVTVGSWGGNNAYFDGRIGEIVVFDSLLNDADRQQVEGYLAWKWGLEGDLPTNHPYKAGAPNKCSTNAAVDVCAFSGGDDGEGLDLTGDFIYAANVGGNGGFDIGDAAFSDVSAPGITFVAQNSRANWASPNFGSTVNDDALETVMTSMRWSNRGNDVIRVDLANLIIGNNYSLQLLFMDTGRSRGWDVFVEGSLIVDDFLPGVVQGSNLKTHGAVVRYNFTATDTVLNITMGGVTATYMDNNPVFGGFTLENITPAPSAIPIVNYRFDELSYNGTSGELVDSGSSGSNGQSAGGTLSQGVQMCNGAVFDGVDDHFFVPPLNADFSAGFSAMAWVDFGAVDDTERIFDFGVGQSNHNISFGRNATSNDLVLHFFQSGCAATAAPNAIIAGRHHYAVAVSATGQRLVFYRDGVEIHNAPQTCMPPNITRGSNYIGRSNWASHDYTEAQIDELKIYNVGLSAAAISTIYNNENAGNNYDGSVRSCPEPPAPVLVAHYRFDELEYNDVENEIIDSIGAFHGRAKVAQPTQGKMCNALDLSAPGIADYAILNENILHNKTDFTVSLWTKTPETSRRAILSGASSVSPNSMMMWLSDKSFTPYVNGETATAMPISAIANDQWHHVVWTRQGAQNCLYVDKVAQGCVTRQTNSLNIQSLLLGQEQDTLGGGFEPEESIEGLIDELLIYDAAIPASQVASLYDAQSTGVNIDGSARVCPVPLPVTEQCSELGYIQVYGLDVDGGDYHNAVPYLVDNAAAIDDGSFNRIAYQMQLEKSGEAAQCVWVSMDAFTDDASLIGVPSEAGSNALFQQNVASMNVFSNAPDIVNGVDITTGNIEFWPFNYLQGNVNSVPEASDSLYDTGDVPNTSIGYGSMQLHNHGANQTLFALNNLSSPQKSIGIGNYVGSSAQPDWTFADNSDDYLVKSINVFVNNQADPELVAEYRFDQQSYNGSAGELIDNSANALNGMSVGGTLSQGAQMCNGATFDGVNDHFILPPISSDFSNGLSTMAWIDFGNVNEWERVIDLGNGESNNNIVISRFRSTNDLAILINSGASECGRVTAPNAITTGRQHYAVTVAADQTVVVYKNGEPIHAETIACLPIDVTRSSNYIGRSNWAVDSYFDNEIDELKIFDGEVSAAYVQSVYTNENVGLNADGSARVCPIPPPVAEYRLDEFDWNGSSAEVLDSSGNDLHGVATNTKPVPGLMCNAADFDRTNVITIANDPLLEVGNNNADYTVNFWMNYRAINPEYSNIIHKGSSSMERTFSAWFEPDSSELSHFVSTNTNIVNHKAGAIPLNTWSMVTLVKEGDQLKTYFDGELARQTTLAEPIISNAGSLYIGDDPWHDGIDGLLDELLIFDSALSDAQIQIIHSNNSQGRSYNGGFRSCPVPASPIAEYRFDELFYEEAADEIHDNIGNFHGRAIDAQPGEGKMCNALDLSATDTNDFAVLDENVLHNKTDFSLSYWAKTSTSRNQAVLSAAGADSDNDLLMFPSASSARLFVKGDDLSINTPNTADNTWQHIVWTRAEDQNCLYVNKVFQGCVVLPSSALNVQSFIIGQEQDNVGGGFKADQAFDGLLDELLIYEEAIPAWQVESIYDAQLASTNFDGSTRTCPLPPSPVAEYRFDALSWSGVNTDVLDSSGNDLHGTATNTQPVPGLMCNAADFDRSNIIKVASNTLLEIGNNNEDYTVNFWLKLKTNTPAWNRIIQNGGNRTMSAWLKDTTNQIHNRAATSNSGDEGHLSGASLSIDTWAMVTIVKEGNQLKTYLDGAFDNENTLSAGTIWTPGILSIGNSDESSQGIDALMDELLIYRSALSAFEIQALHDNNINGNGWNGEARTCKDPVAEYRFNENTWDGSNADVLDTSGNGLHGVATNTQSVPGLVCNAADFNRSNKISVANNPLLEVGAENEDYTVNFWVNPRTTATGFSSIIQKGNTGSERTFALWFNDNATTLNHKVSTTSSGNVGSNTTSTGLGLNIWNMVTLVKQGSQLKTYIDGAIVTDYPLTAPSISNDGILHIGDTPWSTGMDGLMDELIIFRSALSTAEIQGIRSNNLNGRGWDGQASTCQVPNVHHYEVIHDGQGLTCEAESVTVRSCLDASCSILNDQPVSLDFLVDGVVVSSPTFTGSTTVSVSNTDVETVSFSIANTTMASPNPLVCDDGVGTSCNMSFTSAGFRFLYGAGTSIANQTAGIVLNEALQLQAVKDTNGVCTGLFSGNTSVNLSQENMNPGGVNGLSFTTGVETIAKYTGATPIILDFGANSIATIPTPIYHDAGQIRLHANYNVAGVALSGSSNSFWVAPATLEINAQAGGNALNGASAISSVTHPAGENFTLSITAFNGAASPAITQNYVPGNMQFKVTRTAPDNTGSVDGIFKYAFFGSRPSSANATFEDVTLSTFMAGMYGYSGAHYSEVGLLNFDIQDSNYGDGVMVSAADINIGRFVPDYLTHTVIQEGVLFATCGANLAFNAYSGQMDESNASIGAISYSTRPIFAITAFNKQGDVTQNYYEDSQGSANDFMRLDNDDVNVTLPTTDLVALGVDNTLLPVTASMSPGTLSQNDLVQLPDLVALPRGTVHYALSNSDHFFYPRTANAKIHPFVSDFDLVLSTIIDADNISSSSTATASPTGIDIRFGRMRLENSFGSETQGLVQHLKVEHYVGNDFVTTHDNSCVSYNSNKISLINMGLDPNLSGINVSAGHFTNGETLSMELASPGAGNQGVIGVTYEAHEWLQYDWNNDGTFAEDPKATATFGIYRGDDRLFNWREVFD